MEKGSDLNEEMKRKTQCSSSRFEENKGKNGKSKENDHDDDDHITTTTDNDLVILRDFELVNLVPDESVWIIDCGATLHVTPRKELFTSYTSSDFGVFKMGNDGVTKKMETHQRYEKTPPKTPQLNGLAKRMNRTLIERVRCMLSEASPIVALNIVVPDKIWFGKDVMYGHLQVFGCKSFVPVPKDERSKLDMKTRQCIFIEYGHNEYGYRMYDRIEKKLVKSHDVQLMKDQTIEDIDKLGQGFDVPLDDDVEEE
ncbi:hypothetical protein CR513_48753, partial [Mucuna pruriens]